MFTMVHLLNKLPFAHHRWFMYLRLLTRHFLEDNCTQKAASLTYTTLLSLVPMITVLLVIFATVPALSDMREQVQAAIYNNLLPSSSAQIAEYINSFAEKSTGLTTIGIGFLFVTTIMTLITIETAFNQIWRVEEETGGVVSIMRYLVMVIGIPLVLGVAFIASNAVQSLNFLNRQFAGYGIDWGIWVEIVSFLVTIAGFIAMYWFIPKVKVPIKNAVIAGVIIAIIFEIVKRVFGLIIANFTSYEAVYGTFAALPVFLMWIYLSWNLILLGVEISYTLTVFDTKEVPVRHPLLSLLDMLNLIYKNHQKNKATTEQQLRNVLGRKELPKWQTYINQLVHNQLISKTDEGYVLKKDLDTINLWQFYKSLPYPLPIKKELDALRQADYDPWFVELYDSLVKTEESVKDTLNMPLGYLFETTPIRPKQELGKISASKRDSEADNIEQSVASYNADARYAEPSNDSDSRLIIPDGQAAFTQGKVGAWIQKIKTVRHLFGKGKGIAKDIKRNL